MLEPRRCGLVKQECWAASGPTFRAASQQDRPDQCHSKPTPFRCFSLARFPHLLLQRVQHPDRLLPLAALDVHVYEDVVRNLRGGGSQMQQWQTGYTSGLKCSMSLDLRYGILLWRTRSGSLDTAAS